MSGTLLRVFAFSLAALLWGVSVPAGAGGEGGWVVTPRMSSSASPRLLQRAPMATGLRLELPGSGWVVDVSMPEVGVVARFPVEGRQLVVPGGVLTQLAAAGVRQFELSGLGVDGAAWRVRVELDVSELAISAF